MEKYKSSPASPSSTPLNGPRVSQVVDSISVILSYIYSPWQVTVYFHSAIDPIVLTCGVAWEGVHFINPFSLLITTWISNIMISNTPISMEEKRGELIFPKSKG